MLKYVDVALPPIDVHFAPFFASFPASHIELDNTVRAKITCCSDRRGQNLTVSRCGVSHVSVLPGLNHMRTLAPPLLYGRV